MANMSYCRWENTLDALRDCAIHLNDPLSGSEAAARAAILELAAQMLEDAGRVFRICGEAVVRFQKYGLK